MQNALYLSLYKEFVISPECRNWHPLSNHSHVTWTQEPIPASGRETACFWILGETGEARPNLHQYRENMQTPPRLASWLSRDSNWRTSVLLPTEPLYYWPNLIWSNNFFFYVEKSKPTCNKLKSLLWSNYTFYEWGNFDILWFPVWGKLEIKLLVMTNEQQFPLEQIFFFSIKGCWEDS